MNAALFRATLAGKRTPVTILFLLAFAVLLPLIVTRDQLSSAHDTGVLLLPLVIAAGVIGDSLSNGTLALLLTRPLRRRDVVYTKWMAVASASSAAMLAHLALEAAGLALHGRAQTLTALVLNALERVLVAGGVCAVMVCLSSVLPRKLDVATWLIAFLFGAIAAGTERPWLATSGEVLVNVLLPRVNLWRTFAATPIAWSAVAAYVAQVAGALALAACALNEKELSYGSE